MPNAHLPLILRPLAACLAPIYGAAVSVRNTSFDRQWRTIHEAAVPVISVGNLTVGGTGKTPMVQYVVEVLTNAQHHPAVILRGYQSNGGVSDEQTLLSETLPDVPVLADPDRVAAARTLAQDHPPVDTIVLDDGFQHRRIGRQLDLVLLDATHPFGGGHLLPWGLLREPLSSLRRADGVVITRADQVDKNELQKLTDRVEQLTGRKPLATAAHRWGGYDSDTSQDASPTQPVLAFCGIGNPNAFFAQAAEQLTLADRVPFSDHHAYTADDLKRLNDRAKQAGATGLLTTHKDWVKLRPLVQSAPDSMPIWRPVLEFSILSGQESLDQMICRAAQGKDP
jgi:tetraacyldisaccharide 4'-kinase